MTIKLGSVLIDTIGSMSNVNLTIIPWQKKNMFYSLHNQLRTSLSGMMNLRLSTGKWNIYNLNTRLSRVSGARRVSYFMTYMYWMLHSRRNFFTPRAHKDFLLEIKRKVNKLWLILTPRKINSTNWTALCGPKRNALRMQQWRPQAH